MLRINCKNIWHDSDSNLEPTAWEPCCPKPTAVIYFWIKRVGKKEKRPYWMNNFSCILHMRRKITRQEPVSSFPLVKLTTLASGRPWSFELFFFGLLFRKISITKTGVLFFAEEIHSLSEKNSFRTRLCYANVICKSFWYSKGGVLQPLSGDFCTFSVWKVFPSVSTVSLQRKNSFTQRIA